MSNFGVTTGSPAPLRVWWTGVCMLTLRAFLAGFVEPGASSVSFFFMPVERRWLPALFAFALATAVFCRSRVAVNGLASDDVSVAAEEALAADADAVATEKSGIGETLSHTSM